LDVWRENRDVLKNSFTTWHVTQNLLVTNNIFFPFQHLLYFLVYLQNIVLFHCTIIYVNSINTETSFYQHIRLKFIEETSKVIYLEHNFVWCRNADNSKRRSEITRKLERGAGEGRSRSVGLIVWERKKYYGQSRRTGVSYKQ